MTYIHCITGVQLDISRVNGQNLTNCTKHAESQSRNEFIKTAWQNCYTHFCKAQHRETLSQTIVKMSTHPVKRFE